MSQTLIICETCRNPQCYCTCKNAPPSVPVQAVDCPVCFLCGEPDPDYRANWLGNEYVHKDCDREAQRDEERRQMRGEVAS